MPEYLLMIAILMLYPIPLSLNPNVTWHIGLGYARKKNGDCGWPCRKGEYAFSQQTKQWLKNDLRFLSNIPSGNLLKTTLATYGWETQSGLVIKCITRTGAILCTLSVLQRQKVTSLNPAAETLTVTCGRAPIALVF